MIKKREIQFNEALMDNIEEFNDSKFDIGNSIGEAKVILRREMQKNVYIQCDFEDDVWKLFDELQGYRQTFNFTELRGYLQFNRNFKVTKFIDIIKCWAASLLESYVVTNAVRYVEGLKIFLEITQGLTNLKEDDILDYFKTLPENVKKRIVNGSLNFFDYYLDLDNHDQIVCLLFKLKVTVKVEHNTRIIPPSKDIFVFSKIVEMYFNEDLSQEEYLKWFPVWLWWNLTNIIPMRPSEFCSIERECLFREDGNCYIKLPRLKISKTKMKNKIQILKHVYLPYELYKKIEEYISKTEAFGETETLISYLSIPHFSSNGQLSPSYSNDKKLISTKFTKAILDRMLNTFYEKVVFDKYNVQLVENDINLPATNYITQKLKPGDTRHLAFINLKKQGYHPVEIARLGGHTKLSTQEHYFNHVTNSVDLEILELMASNDLDNYVNKFSYRDSHGNSIGPSFVEKYIMRPANTDFNRKMEDGYCTDEAQNCKVEDCWECDSWRITKEEYIMKKTILEEKMEQSKSAINEVIENLKKLYKAIYANIGYDEYYSVDNPELRMRLLNQSKRIDQAVSKYISLTKVKERIDQSGTKR